MHLVTPELIEAHRRDLAALASGRRVRDHGVRSLWGLLPRR